MGINVKFWNVLHAHSPNTACHVTQVAKFETFYFRLILYLILKKTRNFWWESSLLHSEVFSKKLQGGEPKSSLGVNPIPHGVKKSLFSYCLVYKYRAYFNPPMVKPLRLTYLAKGGGVGAEGG